MYGVIIALLPALLVSFYFFGIGSAIVCATSVISCLFFEWAITRYILGQQRLCFRFAVALRRRLFDLAGTMDKRIQKTA